MVDLKYPSHKGGRGSAHYGTMEYLADIQGATSERSDSSKHPFPFLSLSLSLSLYLSLSLSLSLSHSPSLSPPIYPFSYHLTPTSCCTCIIVH